ncbi:MAG: bifunctional 2-polyprenyl-6-hydroxyphenol methylase/3-demethylubiquinol 3-O-methyltransferase UbiG [Rhodospirillaceae bacterium]|nr:bifunctional 2-polyprenyl-6-hydroxyphenol methylase/3-demethylubiquinol 3-O-methyltransferase UbiG [Rhodospirillaceae bacterium]
MRIPLGVPLSLAEAQRVQTAQTTIDADEVARFSAMADEWWDPTGKFRPLHKFNPIRLGYIRDRLCAHFDRDPRSLTPLDGLTLLDVGCGGGLLSEPLARMGAIVTGIDASEKNIGTARAHAARSDVEIDYRCSTAEDLMAAGETFDIVLSLEVVEHVADVDLFLDSCTALVRDGGAMILATLNRTPKAFMFGIVGAEYIMRWLPRGTHDWKKFVRPSELSRGLRRNGVDVSDISGLSFNPLSDEWRVSGDVSVNYILFGTK